MVWYFEKQPGIPESISTEVREMWIQIYSQIVKTLRSSIPSGDADIENRLVDTVGEGEGGMN